MNKPWLDGPLDLECSWVTLKETLAEKQLKTLDNNAAVEVDAGIARIRFIPDAPATEDSHPGRPAVHTRGSLLAGPGGNPTKPKGGEK